MSILIHGMKMPGVCYECYFCTYGFCAHLERYVTAIRERDANCPLVELPPHGDLIDAQMVMMQMQSSDYDTYDDYNRAFDMLDNAPTVIPAEEVPGHE